MLLVRVLAAGCLTCLVPTLARAELSQQALAEIRALPWQPVNGLALNSSHSQIGLMPDFVAVTGVSAQQMRVIGDADDDPLIEADAVNTKTGAEVVYSYQPSGFINGGDWSNVHPDEMIQQIKAATEVGNQKRAAARMPALHVLGWEQAPTYNRDTHAVLWSFNGTRDGGGRIFNAAVLKLGRYGFERIVLIDNTAAPADAMAELLLVANAHQFVPGATYGDYVPSTDHAATYGIAGLVAGVLGVKLVKVGALVGLAVFAKKLVWLAVLPFVWLWRKVRRKKPTKTSAASSAGGVPEA